MWRPRTQRLPSLARLQPDLLHMKQIGFLVVGHLAVQPSGSWKGVFSLSESFPLLLSFIFAPLIVAIRIVPLRLGFGNHEELDLGMILYSLLLTSVHIHTTKAHICGQSSFYQHGAHHGLIFGRLLFGSLCMSTQESCTIHFLHV